jgi:hypothetical protein
MSIGSISFHLISLMFPRFGFLNLCSLTIDAYLDNIHMKLLTTILNVELNTMNIHNIYVHNNNYNTFDDDSFQQFINDVQPIEVPQYYLYRLQ